MGYWEKKYRKEVKKQEESEAILATIILFIIFIGLPVVAIISELI